MSSVFTLDDDPIVLVVPATASIPPGDISEVDWLALKNRVTIVEGMDLASLPDVDLTSLADGNVLIWDDDAEMWIVGTLQSGIRVRDHLANIIAETASDLTFRLGITASQSGDRTYIQPIYGTAANTVAEGNHTHMQPLPSRVTTAPSGYMSGGTRSLGSTSVTLASGIPYVVEAELYGQLRGADAGAAYYTLTLNIGGNTFTSPGGTDGLWCVQGVPDKINWKHERRMTGTGAGVTVSASIAFHSGSGLNVDRTWLVVTPRPDR